MNNKNVKQLYISINLKKKMINLKKKFICIIPARKGSQRIKNKNIINFFGKPMISYAITKALKSKFFDDVLVSTDCPTIMNISKKYKANINSIRPKKYSNNFATIKDVLKYEIKKNNLDRFEYLCCIYPCSGPLLNNKIFKNAINKFLKYDADQLVTITKFEYPPEKSYLKINNNFIKTKYKKFFNTRTQDLNNYFRDTGSLYIYKIQKLINNSILKKITFLEVPRYQLLDIDTLEDLDILKYLYSKKLTKN